MHIVDKMTFTIHFHPQLSLRMCQAMPPVPRCPYEMVLN